MARRRGTTNSPSAKRPIVQYDHKDEKRANNPPVGLVTPKQDRAPLTPSPPHRGARG